MDNQTVITTLCGSFSRQLAVYRDLRDSARASMSKLILSRGDVGVLMAGIDKKSRLLKQIDDERNGVSGEIEYWQAHREEMMKTNIPSAALLNDTLTQMEAVIREFLAEEEKLKQYVEKVYKPERNAPDADGLGADGGTRQNEDKGGAQ